jgi:hypothetical protein
VSYTMYEVRTSGVPMKSWFADCSVGTAKPTP